MHPVVYRVPQDKPNQVKGYFHMTARSLGVPSSFPKVPQDNSDYSQISQLSKS